MFQCLCQNEPAGDSSAQVLPFRPLTLAIDVFNDCLLEKELTKCYCWFV